MKKKKKNKNKRKPNIWNEHWPESRIRKRGFYCISSMYTFELILKRSAQYYFLLPMNRMSDGHIPMATNQTWTGVFWQFWFNWQQSPTSPPFFYSLPSARWTLPMLTVAATFLGYTTNNTNRKQKQQKQNKKTTTKSTQEMVGGKNKQKHIIS